jgi:hypothetical protein
MVPVRDYSYVASMNKLTFMIALCSAGLLVAFLGGCSSSTQPDESKVRFSMTLVGATDGSRNFATHTMATVLTSDTTLAVVGSNTPLNTAVAKNNYALIECLGTDLGRREVRLDSARTPANILVMVNGNTYFAISGSVTITEVGAVGGFVSGVFEATLVGDNDARIQVTNGSFTVRRVADNSRLE